MKKLLTNQQGIVPIVLFAILAVLGVTGVGTIAASNNSKPDDALFALDKTVEEIRFTVAAGEPARVKVRLAIAQERLDELNEIAQTEGEVDSAVAEVQLAIANATTSVSDVETKFKDNKITLTATDIQALLAQLQSILTTHKGLVRKVEVKIKDGEIKAKVKLFETKASESAELVDDDIDDLEDDGKLNASTAGQIEVELKGLVTKVGNLFQLTSGGKTYTLTASQPTLTLDTFVGKTVELKGTALNSTTTMVTVQRIEIEDEVEDEDEDELDVTASPEIEAKGTVGQSAGGFTLTVSGATAYTLTSTINLQTYVGKFVKVEGHLNGTTLSVSEIEVKPDSSGKPVTPALSTVGSSGKKEEVKIEEKHKESEEELEDEDKSGSSNEDSDDNSGSGNDDTED